MTRKCGFFDCNNLSEKGKNRCQSCATRKEQNICSACRQPEPQQYGVLGYKDSFFKIEKTSEFISKAWDKFPPQFKSQINQLLPQLKLSAGEKEQFDKLKKVVSDFLTEKGGKQDHVDWLNFCSVCEPEIDSRMKNFLNQNLSTKSLTNRINRRNMKGSWESY